MNPSSAGRPASAADELRAAVRRLSEAAGWRWSPRVVSLLAPGDPAPAASAPRVRLELSDDDARVLARELRAAADLYASPGRRGPNWTVWVGSEEAARMVGVDRRTIRSWVATRHPRRHPFPLPEKQFLGLNLWRRKTIKEWHEQDGQDGYGGAAAPG